MKTVETPIPLNFKEINIIVHALRIASEDGSLYEHGKQSEIDRIRSKLQNVKG